MLQGTGSDVGKSLLVAGLARAFTQRGLRVRPFKPQNMSNNAAVTDDGGEIGRAQALQARACGIATSVHMNPVLLKPQTEIGAQLVVQGRVEGTASARDYHALKQQPACRACSTASPMSARAPISSSSKAPARRPRSTCAPATSPIWASLPRRDVPVVLVGDIDRGGVIASLVGTMAVLEDEERARIRGFLVNKFRGDVRLFDGGRAEIARRTGLADLGVVPWFDDAVRLPAEDAAGLDSRSFSLRDTAGAARARPLKIAVPRLPRIANFDDLDPLAAEADVSLELRPLERALPGDTDVVLLPGSKATLADLDALRRAGWDVDIAAHRRRGGHVLGLCGGYQMLGRSVADPFGLEGPARTAPAPRPAAGRDDAGSRQGAAAGGRP